MQSATGSADEARALEEQADAIREDLGDLLGELDRRRHRAARPVAVAAGLVAVVGLAMAGVLRWRRRKAGRTWLGLARGLFRGGEDHGRHRA